jgi:hypothetical protein
MNALWLKPSYWLLARTFESAVPAEFMPATFWELLGDIPDSQVEGRAA